MTASSYLSLAAAALAVLARPSAAQREAVPPPSEATPRDDHGAPHQGCLLFLQANHTATPPLVGAAYAATQAAAAQGYDVANEVGPTSSACVNGMAGGYACDNVDLLSLLDLADLGVSMVNDLWGWTDGASGREFALVGTSGGTSFVEVTDPYQPVIVGFLPTATGSSSWRDVKTAGDWALVVSEASNHGLQLFDLTQLLDAVPGTAFDATVRYTQFGNAHNVFVDEDTGVAYVVGSSSCNGGLHMIDVADPANPAFAGCYGDDGYTHDVQCVVYAGPDARHTGKEICFASNEDTVTIVDVTDKANPVQLSRTGYSGARYTHQGWLTEDHAHFLFDDELDELRNGVLTRTHVLDVVDLQEPAYVGHHAGRTAAIDHNMYVVADRVYQANYRAGLNVLKIIDAAAAEFEEDGFFDVWANGDNASFNGAWSNYPFFPSGNVLVSAIEGGLFVVRHGAAGPAPAPPTAPPVAPPTAPPVSPPPTAPPVAPPTAPPVAPPTAPPVAPPTAPPVAPPTATPPGVPPPLRLDLFHLRFAFAPRGGCVLHDAVADRAAGTVAAQCAQACASLEDCPGFVVFRAGEDAGACVLTGGAEVDDGDACASDEFVDVWYYDRDVTLVLEP